MKKIIYLLTSLIILISCKDKKNEPTIEKDNRISLRSDTLNVVKLTDTLVIYESTCRGCAYENSTAFVIKDSLDLVKLLTVETMDNSPAGMAGGSVSKHLIIVPVKTGSTTIKMYRFWEGVPVEMNDSLPFTPYQIEVRN
jgi:hypothetical protein